MKKTKFKPYFLESKVSENAKGKSLFSVAIKLLDKMKPA